MRNVADFYSAVNVSDIRNRDVFVKEKKAYVLLTMLIYVTIKTTKNYRHGIDNIAHVWEWFNISEILRAHN